MIGLTNVGPLQVAKHDQWVLVDWSVEGIHELLATQPNLSKDAFHVLLDSIYARINPSHDLVTRYRRLVDLVSDLGCSLYLVVFSPNPVLWAHDWR